MNAPYNRPTIPPESLPTLFDPLKRYATRESAAHRTPGSIGLGLYIVREIVVAKGGTVTVTSEGCGFRVAWTPLEGRTESSLVCPERGGLAIRKSTTAHGIAPT